MNKLLSIIACPDRMVSMSIQEWDDIIRFSRHARLLGYLRVLVERHKLDKQLPSKVLDILAGAEVYNNYFRLRASYELRKIAQLFQQNDLKIVLLKGAAYIASEIYFSKGRRLSDVDLLVEQNNLKLVEQVLLKAGYQYKHVSEYDQKYYRDWMHEIPPLVHTRRNMEVDLHHNIIAPVSRIKVDANKLFDQAVPIPGSRFYRLEAKDLILHSAAHLFFNDELRGGLRDLVDMHELCLEFGERKDFWPNLVPRARELGMQRPLYYALSSLHLFFNTPVPNTVIADIQKDKPVFPVNIIMSVLIQRLLAPNNVEKMNAPVVQWLLFIRSHWIRMPLPMLIKHLSYKFYKNLCS